MIDAASHNIGDARHGNGGVAARRAVTRWALRMFRREWRQQVLVTGLLSFTVAVAVFAMAAAYNVVPSAAADFGTANHRLELRATELDAPGEQLVALADWFGTIEVIGHRDLPVPGSTTGLDVRAQDPAGAFSRPTLALREGRYPTSGDEIGLTDGAAEVLATRLGDTTIVGGRTVLVVGLVENPADLRDEFALSGHRSVELADSYTVLVTATDERAVELPASIPVSAIERRGRCHATLVCLSAGQSEQATAAAAALGLATLLLLLVALVAAAGFTVIALRRQRQLGLLSANGATEAALRSVVLVNGAVTGLLAAVLGTVLGIAAWLLVAPLAEPAAGHRIDRLHLPIVLLALAMVLCVAVSVGASSAPARRVARVPVMSALSGRPPTPRPSRRAAVRATVSMAIGLAALSHAVDAAADHVNPPLLIGGIGALVLGVASISSTLLSVTARLADLLPIGPRLAIRDLSRYRSRSAIALSAISLALAISTTATVAAAAASPRADEGNLSNRQLLLRVGDDPLQVPELGDGARQRAREAAEDVRVAIGAVATPLDVAVDANERVGPASEVRHPAVVLGRPVGGGTIRDIGVLYVATDLVTRLVGLAPSPLPDDVSVLSPYAGEVAFANVADRSLVPRVHVIAAPPYSSMPSSLITPNALTAHGWIAAPAGWLLETDHPLAIEDLRAARRFAAAAGLTIETRDSRPELASIQRIAAAVGALFALGVVALTLSLLRAETAGDLRVLTANGASRRVRRTLSATTGGALTAAGAMMGGVAAYAGLIAGYATNRHELARVPVTYLGVLLVGVPAAAAALSWVLSRQPHELAHGPND